MKNLLKTIGKKINDVALNSFEDFYYSKRMKMKVIEGVTFIPEHKCFTGLVGTVEFSSANVKLYNALKEQGLEIIPTADEWIDSVSLSKEEFEQYSNNESVILDPETKYFEKVNSWLVLFKEEKQLNFIKA